MNECKIRSVTVIQASKDLVKECFTFELNWKCLVVNWNALEDELWSTTNEWFILFFVSRINSILSVYTWKIRWREFRLSFRAYYARRHEIYIRTSLHQKLLRLWDRKEFENFWRHDSSVERMEEILLSKFSIINEVDPMSNDVFPFIFRILGNMTIGKIIRNLIVFNLVEDTDASGFHGFSKWIEEASVLIEWDLNHKSEESYDLRRRFPTSNDSFFTNMGGLSESLQGTLRLRLMTMWKKYVFPVITWRLDETRQLKYLRLKLYSSWSVSHKDKILRHCLFWVFVSFWKLFFLTVCGKKQFCLRIITTWKKIVIRRSTNT